MEVDISYRCRSTRHPHFMASRVQAMVLRQELRWIGRHRKVAVYLDDKTWAKIYNRNWVGEVLHCGLQLVRGARR